MRETIEWVPVAERLPDAGQELDHALVGGAAWLDMLA